MPGIITRLLEEGLYENIICSILDYLDGPSLEALSSVSKVLNSFIHCVYLQSSTKQTELRNGWIEGISLSKCFVASSGISSVKADVESILLGLIDGKAELWQRSGKKFQLESPNKIEYTPYNTSVTAVDLGLKYFVTGYSNGSVSLWDRSNGKLVGSLKSFYKSEVISVNIFNDSYIFVAVTNGSVHKAIVHKNGDLIFDSNFHIFLGFKNLISDISVCDKLILVGTTRALLWKSSTGEKVGELIGGHDSSGKITRVCLNKKYAITGSEDQTAVVWSLETKKILRILVHSSPIRFLALNNQVIITGDDYSDLLVWDTYRAIHDDDVPLRVRKGSNIGGLLLKNLTGHSGCIVDACLTSTCLITSDSVGLTIERDITQCLVEGPKLQIVRCPKGINAMACDSNYIVCGLLDKKIAVYDRLTLKHLMNLSGHSDHVWHIVMNDQFMVSGSWDSTVIVWRKKNPREWNMHTRISHPRMREVSGLCYVKDIVYTSSLCGSLLAFKLCYDGSSDFVLWGEAETKSLGSIYSLTTDGKYLISGHVYNSTTVQLWDMDMIPIRAIEEIKATNIVWDIHLSYPLTLVCRDNEKLDICDLENRTRLKRLVHEFKVLNAVIKDGIIIAGCLHGILVFWSLNDCLLSEEFEIHHSSALFILREHSAGIPNIFIDNDTIITDDYDGVVCIRKLNLYNRLKSIFNIKKEAIEYDKKETKAVLAIST